MLYGLRSCASLGSFPCSQQAAKRSGTRLGPWLYCARVVMEALGTRHTQAHRNVVPSALPVRHSDPEQHLAATTIQAAHRGANAVCYPFPQRCL